MLARFLLKRHRRKANRQEGDGPETAEPGVGNTPEATGPEGQAPETQEAEGAEDPPEPPSGSEALKEEPLIDVRALIARYSNAEHIARANAYFASMPEDALLLRKPFFGMAETQLNMLGVSEVLQRLKLFPGAAVLDFGAGTGWLSKVFAYIGCAPIAVDVSESALALGRRAFERDPLAKDLSIDWRVFDGARLPLEDESVDRVVCYDSFHHVADQAAILREFYRVLVTGGRIVFHEPGPTHSKTPEAQYEMRHHDVIENDIVIEDIWRIAQELGFTGLELALSALKTVALPIERYNRAIAGNPAPDDVAAILQNICDAGAGLRIFSMVKGTEIVGRAAGEMTGHFDVLLTETQGDTLHGHARATNTGAVRWRGSVLGAGAVWLGVKQGGKDYGRVWLSAAGVEPGGVVEVDFTLPAPAERPAELVFDLVAEGVMWFQDVGTAPVRISVT